MNVNSAEPIVLIPSFNPDQKLLDLVNDVICSGFFVIVVNDGSKIKSKPIFDNLKKVKGCEVLEHSTNLGKGRAIKTGINYVMLNFPDSVGIVTADSDGQHTVKDIINVADKLKLNNKALILGCRKFQSDVPLRSRLGNIITRYIFRFIIGKNVSDTQTGLRGIPSRYFSKFMTLKGEKYEYEINVLAFVGEKKGPIIEVPIDTIYIDNNKASHFDPLFDSMRIYFVLLRFLFSSMVSAIIDYLLFAVFFLLSENLPCSAIIARGISISVNYNINSKWVFPGIISDKKRFLKFLALAGSSLTCSCLLVSYLADYWGLSVFVVKIMVESTLFLFNFAIQKQFIFCDDTES